MGISIQRLQDSPGMIQKYGEEKKGAGKKEKKQKTYRHQAINRQIHPTQELQALHLQPNSHHC